MSRPRLIALLLALTTLLAYLPVTRSGFVQYDDDDYVTHNPAVQHGLTLSGIHWAFTTVHASNWHPLTWLSHMMDCELFGLNPAAHHFVNVLFHAANTVLLFALLLRLAGASGGRAAVSGQPGVLWPAALVAALFAWHPLHVESVAWVAERKDVLSTCFALLTLLSYAKFAGEQCRRSFWHALIFFALGLMAKPMLVTLPFVMLLLDYWPLRRIPGMKLQAIRTRVLEKWPFFLLALLSCIMTFLAQRSTAVVSLDLMPLGFRLQNAPVAYVAYLSKTFWPAGLAVIYPLPAGYRLPPLEVTAAAAVLILVSAAVWLCRKRAPYLLVGWLWFLGTLVPVIGLVQVGAQALADRYTYLPVVGLFIMAAFGGQDLVRRFHISKPAVAAIVVLVLAACLSATEIQLSYWRNGEVLFRHALAVTQNNDIAHINLGVALQLEGRLDEAIAENRAAEALTPDRYQIHNNLGGCFELLGKPQEALAEYREAVRLNPKSSELHLNLGIVLAELGRDAEALGEFTNAARLNPVHPSASFQMAKTLLEQGHNAEAAAALREALWLAPDDLQILTYSAHVLASIQDPGVRDGRMALGLATKANELSGGGQAIVLNALGMAQAETGDFTNAILSTQTALDLAEAAQSEKLHPLQNQLRRELQLYQNHQPWRESFLDTNPPAPLLPPD